MGPEMWNESDKSKRNVTTGIFNPTGRRNSIARKSLWKKHFWINYPEITEIDNDVMDEPRVYIYYEDDSDSAGLQTRWNQYQWQYKYA